MVNRVAQFYKVSEAQFVADWLKHHPGDDAQAAEIYRQIRLPQRATRASAGYDFFLPTALSLAYGETILIPTGVRVTIERTWVMVLVPRSSLGFRHRLMLDNTLGVIDADYAESPNEGHIMLKLTHTGQGRETIALAAGAGICQGIFLPYGITVDDQVSAIRTGGFGSTDEKICRC